MGTSCSNTIENGDQDCQRNTCPEFVLTFIEDKGGDVIRGKWKKYGRNVRRSRKDLVKCMCRFRLFHLHTYNHKGSTVVTTLHQYPTTFR